MEDYQTYSEYIKPDWAPPAYVFGPVWSLLYTIIFISFSYVFWLVWNKEIPQKVALPFILNLVSNFAFMPIQFGIQNNWLAFSDILIVWGTLIWAMKAIWPYRKWVTYAQIPYLLWVTFATYLQLTITLLNG